MNNPVFTVSEITEKLRFTLETRFPYVCVNGEVCNLSRPASGHIYFSMKDRDARLQCVLLKPYRSRLENREVINPLTGEVFQLADDDILDILQNGIRIICAGHISIYSPRGQYQLFAELIIPSGYGSLAREFEEKKRKLSELGYFLQARKRMLPKNPVRVALVTSEHGAAIHDFWRLAQERGCSSRIRLFPVTVQGDSAADEIASSIRLANSQNWSEVIVLIRGGGSAEDLCAFNDEKIAKAIFESRVPVLAGIGHEIDFTIADLTADVRAATPSHAAQLLWPLRSELSSAIDGMSAKLQMSISEILKRKSLLFEEKYAALKHVSPEHRLEKMQAEFALKFSMLQSYVNKLLMIKTYEQTDVCRRLRHSVDFFLDKRIRRYERADAVLAASNPSMPLRRGFALVYAKKGSLIRSINKLTRGQTISVQMADGGFDATIREVGKAGE